MSNLDDIDGDIWDLAGLGFLGLLFAIGIVSWAIYSDHVAEQTCLQHGEKYIDNRWDYTLCEQDGGAVVNR